jgi:hypothetical protein
MKNLYNRKEDELINHLKSFEVTPPDGLWNGIEATLHTKRKRKIYFTISWTSAAVVALFFTISGIYSTNHSASRIASGNRKNSTTAATTNAEVIEKQEIRSIKIGNTDNQNITSESLTRNELSPLQDSSTRVDAENLSRNDRLPEKIISIQSTISNSNVTSPDRIEIKVQGDPAPSGSIAQVEKKEKRLKGNWYISASGFPEYSFHTAGVMGKSKNQNEAGIVTWGGSLAVRYAFSKTVSIEMGLTYNVLGQQENNIYLVTNTTRGNDVVTYTGFSNSYGQLSVVTGNVNAMDLEDIDIDALSVTSTTSYSDVTLQQRFSYLEIPVLLDKGFKIKGFNLNLKAGFSASFLIGNKLDLRATNLHLKGKTNGVDSFTTSAIASLGFSYPIVNHINLLVEPTFKLGLKSLSTGNGKNYPFSTYIKFGVEIPI